MRSPSLLSQCLAGLLSHDRTAAHCVNVVPEKEPHLSSPAVEIVPSKNVHPYKYAGENIELHGMNIFKGKISVVDIVGLSKSDIVTSKGEGPLKCWESSIDLVNVLKDEIRDGLLTFRSKRVLELGCGYGLPGIFACLKGASTVHFQDPSAETEDDVDASSGIGLGFCEDDLLDGDNSQDGNNICHETSSRRSRKLSSSRAWERGNGTSTGDGGYDIVLVNEIPYSANSLQNLYSLIKKCLRPPYGVLYLAARKNYIGSSSAVRQLRALVDEEGTFGVHLVSEPPEREIWKFFFK
ncbi:unnamed protein product [Urochloa decumbens]|uniref:Uncharacterized protein n=1 Tax=Urochloa decumbens TaxID=240449 RepID=A0ABC9FDV4_9POAL